MAHNQLFTAFSLALFLAAPAPVSGAQQDFSTAEEKARTAHERSMSDVMYQQEDFRALYYQNIEIIQLLQEIRDEVHTVNLRSAKETGK